MSECQCVLPDGAVKLFCERHQCTKYRRLVELCSAGARGEPRARDYWKAWEAGHGPGQAESEATKRQPKNGPGTELKAIFAELGITPKKRCSCNSVARRMNRLGVEGCRKQRDKIVARLRKGQSEYSWPEKLKAAALAVATGLAFSIDWTDPFPGLVDEAIRRFDCKVTELAELRTETPNTIR